MKDDYKKLSNEWGSKRRKQDSRAAKSTLRKPTREDMEDPHAEDPNDLEAPALVRVSSQNIEHAIRSYDTINLIGVLRLAKALKEAYAEIDRLKDAQ